MTFFVLACLLVIGAALVLQSTAERGVLVVDPIVWVLILVGLGVWSLVLTF